ncbi:MAG TPA: PKD domain-containing protein [Candidatus Saccharimonadales bacterium]|nr:PKD domain-containing protein [Candidatus Saccharimonadales bacterium]
MGLFGGLGLGVGQVSAVDNNKDCDQNALISCGFTSRSDFINKVKSNTSGGSPASHDLIAVYAHFGLESADYDKFITSARDGLIYRDGTVKVDGQIVGKGAITYGRSKSTHGSSAIPEIITVNGAQETLWGSAPEQNFAAVADSIPVEAMFNSKGVMTFAVMTSCGNTMHFTSITPNYSCDALNVKPVDDKPGTFNFTTSATANNNATVAKVVYDFGDGTTQTVSGAAALSTVVPHTYTKTANYTAKVTVYVHLPGNQTVVVASTKCQHVVQVTLPFFQCVQLDAAIIGQSDPTKLVIKFVAQAKVVGGATLTSGDFDFGDGTPVQSGVKPDSATTVTVTHTYTSITTDSKFNPNATLHFMVAGQAKTANGCPALVTPTTTTPECKPGIPVGSPACLPPCQPGSSVPPDSPECTPPQLPKTGAGNTIAIFAAVVIAGFMVYRQLLFRKHRAAFLAAEQGTSPLPLGDPLSTDAPLAGTPLAHTAKHRTLRRKRHF